MKTKSNILPKYRVEIDTIGGKTTVSLWDGTYREHTIEDELGRQTEYEYELYLMDVQDRPDLADEIEKNFDRWYSAAKKREIEEKQRKETAEYEAEMMKNLPELLLEMNFQLMMLSSQDEEI